MVVKWFKKGEEFEEEALWFRGEVLSSAISTLSPELLPLEVCRAIVKVGYSSERVEEAYATLGEMAEFGFLEFVSTAMLTNITKDLIVRLDLHVADALSLAAAIVKSSDLLTEDRHLLGKEVKETMKRRKLKVIRLRELSP